MLAKETVRELIKQTEVNIINPIPMAWKKSSSEPTPSGSAMEPSSPVLTTEVSTECEMLSTSPIPSECVSVYTKKVLRQPTSVVSEDSLNDSSELNNRMSIRRKQIPLTRGNDFLWG